MADITTVAWWPPACAALAAAAAAMKASAPVSEPYVHLYAARADLEAALARLPSLATEAEESDAPEGVWLAWTRARLLIKCGVNYIVTEETSSSEEPLVAGLSAAARLALRPPVRPWNVLTHTQVAHLLCDALDAANHLALLYSGWEKPVAALVALRVGMRLYSAFMLPPPPPEGDAAAEDETLLRCAYVSTCPTAGADSSSDASDDASDDASGDASGDAPPRCVRELLRAVAGADALYTHLLFYAAQIYGALKQSYTSMTYAYATLKRQLTEQGVYLRQAPAAGFAFLREDAPSASLDRPRWADATLRLGDYFLSHGMYTYGGACAAAAGCVLTENALAHAAEAAAAAAAADSATGGAAAPAAAAEDATAKPTHWRDMPEVHQAKAADVAMYWGKLYMCILRGAKDLRRLVEAAAENELRDVLQHMTHTFEDEQRVLRSIAAQQAAEASAASPVERAEEDPFSTDAPIPRPVAGPVGAVLTLDAPHAARLLRFQPVRVEEGSVEVRVAGCDGPDETDALRTALLLPLLTRAAALPPAIRLPALARCVASPLMDTLPFYDYLCAAAPALAAHMPWYGPARLGPFTWPGRVPCALQDMPHVPTTATFENARALFTSGLAAYQRALEFYVVDGFVTSHIQIVSAVANGYYYLAQWESDNRRIGAMHSRRVEMCLPVLQVINPGVYLASHRDLSVVIGDALQSMYDARAARIRERVEKEGGGATATELAEKNDLRTRAIGAYIHFIRCFKDPRVPPLPLVPNRSPVLKPGAGVGAQAINKHVEGAMAVEDENVAVYLSIIMSTARLFAGSTAAVRDERMADLRAASDLFQWLMTNAKALKPAEKNGPFFKEELRICQEMAQLVQQQLALLQRLPATSGAGATSAASAASAARTSKR